MNTSVSWIPTKLFFQNYIDAFYVMDYVKTFFNTVIVMVLSAVLEVAACGVAAYGFARFKFKGRGLLFGLVLLTAIVPVQILVIPQFLNYRYFNLGYLVDLINLIPGVNIPFLDLSDSPFTFWLPSMFGVGLRSGLFVFIYRQFFKGLPKELEEAAYIDGASALTAYIRVILPSSGVAMLTVSIFSIVWHWNDYYLSSMFFNNNPPLSQKLTELRTLLDFSGQVTTITKQELVFLKEGILACGCLVTILPPLILYIFAQKFFTEGLERSGIVG